MHLLFFLVVKDHPRSRGNYCLLWKCIDGGSGSPPLTRELPIMYSEFLPIGRITPAHAGTTLKDPLFTTATYSDTDQNHLVCL